MRRHNQPRNENIDDQITINTGLLQMFLQRCSLAFNQMLFEQIQSLLQALQAFINQEEYKYNSAPILFESWVESKAKLMENEAMKINPI